MNQIAIIGRMVRDAEIKTTSSGKNYATFAVAVNKRSKDEPADFFEVKVWDKTAEYVSNYGGKGREIAVFGRMESRKHEDKTYWNLNANDVKLIGGVRDDAPASGSKDEYDPFAE